MGAAGRRARVDRRRAARPRAVRRGVPPPPHRGRASRWSSARRCWASRSRPIPATRCSTRSSASVAVVWVVGGVVSGPLHLGYIPFRGTLRRPARHPDAARAGGRGGVRARRAGGAPDRAVAGVHRARAGARPAGQPALVTVLTLGNGAAEEVFFRGALFAAIGRRHPVLISTVIYALVTIATGNPMLVFAAVIMGVLFGLQRRASGGHPGLDADPPHLVGRHAVSPAADHRLGLSAGNCPGWCGQAAGAFGGLRDGGGRRGAAGGPDRQPEQRQRGREHGHAGPAVRVVQHAGDRRADRAR